MAIAPWLRPQALDMLLLRNKNLDRRFSESGGREDRERAGFLPTRQTALFVIAGDDLAARLRAMRLLAPDARLLRHKLVAAQGDGLQPWLPLDPHPDFIARLMGAG